MHCLIHGFREGSLALQDVDKASVPSDGNGVARLGQRSPRLPQPNTYNSLVTSLFPAEHSVRVR